MTRDEHREDSAQRDSHADSLLVVFKTISDTTWRMFVPPALGAVIGLQFEHNGMSQAAVWGAIIGLVIAGLLVWQQYRAVNRGAK